jgi:hypothetical protein
MTLRSIDTICDYYYYLTALSPRSVVHCDFLRTANRRSRITSGLKTYQLASNDQNADATFTVLVYCNLRHSPFGC